MYKIKRGDIRYCTDANSYTRGLRYFEQGRVKSLRVKQINGDEVVLRSEVQGRDRQPYEQEIDISGLETGDIDIDGRCSCPVAFNCKHVVAACLKFQSNPDAQNADESSAMIWLDEFARAGEVAEGDTDGEFIAYLLKPGRKPGVLSVQFNVTRYLKKGGLGKGRRAELHNFSSDYMRPRYAREVDQEIGRLIKVQNEYLWGAQQYTLTGELGALVLTKMLATGRCFWQDTGSPPLQLGAARAMLVDWHEQRNGDMRLEITVQPEAMVLNTIPALYLDAGVDEIGVLQGADFTAEQWAMLLSSPVVPAKDVGEFSRRLLLHLSDTPLPPPREMETIDIGPLPPTPRLFLFSVEGNDGQRIHMMRLRFAYEGYELSLAPPTPVRSVAEGDKIVRVHRDLSTEEAALEKLFDEGFLALPDEQHGDINFFSPAETGLMDSAARWQRFLEEVLPALEEAGWEVDFDSDFQLQFLHADDWEVAIDTESDHDWFDLRFDLEVKGRKLPLLPLISEVLASYEPDNLPETLTLPLGGSQYLNLPSERIRPVCQVLYELYDAQSLDDDGAMRMSRFDAGRLTELELDCGTELQWRGGKALRELGRKLKDFQGIETVAPPKGLKASLRSYQQQGLNWLQFLRGYEFNGILADDMGLGKTVQTLAHLLLEKEQGRMDKPCLIIAPTSLMSNWRREAQQFTAALSVLVLQGPQRRQHFASIGQYDLVLSTYPLLARDQEDLLQQDYHYLILDEAQIIKNPRAKAARVAREIKARHRLCLTGTPMENHLGELWALFDFLMPGFLGDTKLFQRRFRTPIEKHGDSEQRQRLVRRIAPFMLRRTKDEVIKELPEKTEIIRAVALDTKQAALYESIRLSMEKKVRDAIASKGLARSHITVLDALLKLRQTCCDPQLLSLAQAKKVRESAKLEMLMEMLPEMLEEGRRILLFSQFTKMLALIEQALNEAGITYTKLTGQTRKRDEAIERFRQGQVDVFLISLKAGGVGLNLTEADTVIHYDPWWNPATENQATDRAHRIGQNKAVFVYKLITENTVEEKIVAMQARKQALADGVYKGGSEGEDLKLSTEDLQELFAPLNG